MEPNWSKFDRGLSEIYANYLDLLERKGDPKTWVHPSLRNDAKELFITITYKGNDQTIQDLGLGEIHIEREGIVNCVVDLDKIAKLSHSEFINKMSYGQEYDMSLDNSTKNIKARGNSSGIDGLWAVDQSNGHFTGLTGEGVIVGIIDSGIDYKHESFKKIGINETRILRIWDQGLIKLSTENAPLVSHLSAGPTYGVVYTDIEINAELASPSNPSRIRHRDCHGHGTHVAGIAAGNGQVEGFTGSPKFEYVGVAPKADIVVVKLIDIEHTPSGGNANWLKRFKDAITYIIKIGEELGLPVVINCSFGNIFGSHDGLDEGEDVGFDAHPYTDGEHIFLENTFKNDVGKICVFAAGNDAGRNQHAIVTIPASGEIEIPVSLNDSSTFRQSFKGCRYQDNRTNLVLQCWYKNSISGVKVSFKPQGASTFSTEIALGHYTQNRGFDSHRRFSIFHNRKKAKRNGVDVLRNYIDVSVSPYDNSHLEGTYTLKLIAPAGSEFHLWALHKKDFGFRFINNPLNSNIIITDRNTHGIPGDSPYVISVAAYDDTDDKNRMALFSSQGPLLDYSGLGLLANKPDIAAPGLFVFSSRSYDARVSINQLSRFIVNNRLGFNYREMHGTSMAAPHITGLVALMLQKNNNQNLSDIKSRFVAFSDPLLSFPSTDPPTAIDAPLTGTEADASSDEQGIGRPDVLATLNNVPTP